MTEKITANISKRSYEPIERNNGAGDPFRKSLGAERNKADWHSDGRSRVDMSSPIRMRYDADTTFKKFTGEASTPKESIDLLEKYKKAEPEAREEEKDATRGPSLEDSIPEYKFVGEAFNCYLIIEYEGALLVIDKHAAHERVIFEDLKRSRKQDGRVASQLLMLPVSVIPGAVEMACAIEYKSDIEAVGFEFNVNGNACDIVAVPESISPQEAEELFLRMLDEIKDGRGDPAITDSVRREKALYQVACKAAIKGGRVYDRAIHEWLINKVLALPDITVCPHGRPIAYKLTKNELDRQFDRIK